MSDETNPKDLLGLRKPPLRLVPPALTLFVSRVMGLGATKYGPYNWRTKKVRQTVYLEAAMRHIQAALDGENLDPESGIWHEAHAAACMGIILDARACGCLIDDRPTPGPAARLIAELTEKEMVVESWHPTGVTVCVKEPNQGIPPEDQRPLCPKCGLGCCPNSSGHSVGPSWSDPLCDCCHCKNVRETGTTVPPEVRTCPRYHADGYDADCDCSSCEAIRGSVFNSGGRD